MTQVVRWKWICVGALVALATDAVASNAKDPPKLARLHWITQSLPPGADVGRAPLDKRKPRLFSRIIPENAFTVPSEMDTGGNSIPAGAIIVRTANTPTRFCEPMRRRKQPQIYCVADADGDDILDTLYVVPTTSLKWTPGYWITTSYEFSIGTFEMFSGRSLRVPVAIKSLSPAQDMPPVDVFLDSDGKTDIAICLHRYTGSTMLDGGGNQKFCVKHWNVRHMALPATVTASHGSVTLSRSADGTIQGEINPPPAGMTFPDEE